MPRPKKKPTVLLGTPEATKQIIDHLNTHPPLTLREFFAAFCMGGMVARGAQWEPEECAGEALVHADALINLLEKESGNGT